MADALPKCGLYRTSRAHPERAEQIPAGRLVYFHNHSESGSPIVLPPKSNAVNKWTFDNRGFLVRDPSWPASLVALKAEGFYRMADPLRTRDGKNIPEGQVIQLGYNGAGEPIAFFASYDAERNALVFPTKGTKLSERGYDRLVALTWGGAVAPKPAEHA